MVKADTINLSHDFNNNEMKEYPLITTGRMSYPVGENILFNIGVINEMSEGIYLVINEHYQLSDIKNIIIFCKGSSGAIIGGIVSLELAKLIPNKNIVIHHIKKEGEESHHSSFLDSSTFDKSLTIIVDDFISSGYTINSILERVHAMRPETIIDILCVSGGIYDSIPKDKIRYGIHSK
jgi:adenine/guanine phosphoribosyltransferase-like PRPP-binding protein